MKTRLATEQDLPALSRIGVEFAAEADLVLVPDLWMAMWRAILESKLGEILFMADEAENILGAICLLYSPSLMDGELMAQEAAWFVRKDARGCGLRLLAAAEKRAKERGASSLTMAHLYGFNDRLGSVYARRGYKLVEVVYKLELTP